MKRFTSENRSGYGFAVEGGSPAEALPDFRGDVVIGTSAGEGSSDIGLWNAEEMATLQMRDATVELVRGSFRQMTAAPSIAWFAEQLRGWEAADAAGESRADEEEH